MSHTRSQTPAEAAVAGLRHPRLPQGALPAPAAPAEPARWAVSRAAPAADIEVSIERTEHGFSARYSRSDTDAAGIISNVDLATLLDWLRSRLA